MNILLCYASNSGSTYLTSKIIEETLNSYNFKVVKKPARDVNLQDIETANLIIMGSPSWLIDKVQGMPHETIIALMQKFYSKIRDKRFALFGCGDSSYTHFCKAVEHMEDFVKINGATNIMPSLKIDGFYFDLKDTQEQAYAWTTVLADNLS